MHQCQTNYSACSGHVSGNTIRYILDLRHIENAFRVHSSFCYAPLAVQQVVSCLSAERRQ